jgi:hypothetical protein
VTTEQAIVLAFIAGAFLAGWATAALTGALLRRRGRRAELGGPPPAPAVAANGPRPGRPLAEEVGEALANDVANHSMLSVFGGGAGAALSELEADLADWGFTYGVAWARAAEQGEREGDEEVAGEALDAAREVFGSYTQGADWRPPGERRG